jgi:hypothetical protein
MTHILGLRGHLKFKVIIRIETAVKAMGFGNKNVLPNGFPKKKKKKKFFK